MITLLLSPEQIQDAQGVAWMRDATPEESQALKDKWPQLYSNAGPEGRPYFPVTIDINHPEFPPHLLRQVTHGLRIFRFQEQP